MIDLSKRLRAWILLAALATCLNACQEAPPETAVEPGEEYPGGETTNTLFFGVNAFIRHAQNITDEHRSSFHSGNSFFNQAWVQAPASTTARDGLGPLFNARSCSACHFKDGRGRPPLEPDEQFISMLFRLSVPGAAPDEAPHPDPNYGDQFQPFAVPNVPGEGTPFLEYTEVSGEYDDGEPYTLLRPTYRLEELNYGPLADNVEISPRVAPAVLGLGLLEAIPESRLNALADPDDADGDGISGRVNLVWDAVEERMAVGRFGWKSEQPTVAQQTAGAFLGDIGATTPIFTTEDCTEVQTDCLAAESGGDPEVQPNLFDKVVLYTSLIAVPKRRVWSTPDILAGKATFKAIGCAKCHVPRHETVSDHPLVEVRDQLIWPYTDLLLHDMGPDLADGRPVFGASGSEWRTPPLWGIGLYEVVNKHNRLLHDGRARGVAEAILWHGGEGESAKLAFAALTKEEREQLVRFVESL